MLRVLLPSIRRNRDHLVVMATKRMVMAKIIIIISLKVDHMEIIEMVMMMMKALGHLKSLNMTQICIRGIMEVMVVIVTERVIFMGISKKKRKRILRELMLDL